MKTTKTQWTPERLAKFRATMAAKKAQEVKQGVYPAAFANEETPRKRGTYRTRDMVAQRSEEQVFLDIIAATMHAYQRLRRKP